MTDTTPNLTDIESVKTIIKNAIPLITDTQNVSLDEALGRVLAQDVRAPFDIPAFDNAAMDGFGFNSALLHTDTNSITLPVTGISLAGHPYDKTVAPNHAIRIMTGAALPVGVDTVIPFEKVKETAFSITFSPTDIKAGANVRRRGENFALNTVVMAAGKLLNPMEIGLAASLGYAQLKVIRRPRVTVFATGDELVMPGEVPQEGQIYNSNMFLIAAMCRRWGCDVQSLGILPDNPTALQEALRCAAQTSDFIVTSGGVGAGDKDYITQSISKLGNIKRWHLNMKPGKPFSFGEISTGSHRAFFFGLPGNPCASAISCAIFLRWALLLSTQRADAMDATNMDQLTGTLAPSSQIKLKKGIHTFLAANIDTNRVFSISEKQQGSAMLNNLVDNNVLLHLDGDKAFSQDCISGIRIKDLFN